MPSIDEWKQKQEQMALYRLTGSEGGSSKLLEVGEGNRIVSTKQAKMITRLRIYAGYLGKEFEWMGRIADMVEDYQITCGKPENSRSQFLRALIFDEKLDFEKSKSGLFGMKGGI